MQIRRAAPADLDSIDPLHRALWPDSPIEELKARADAMLASPPAYLVLIARSGEHAPAGFAEVAVRHDYVNGCESSPVAFLEGIYVAPPHRKQGVARALVEEALSWASERGLSEFASDVLLGNEASLAFHEAVGFLETERVVYFRRWIGEAAA